MAAWCAPARTADFFTRTFETATRALCQDIVELRRGDHFAERLRLDLERFAESTRAERLRALEIVLDESKKWPEVTQAFREAFALFKRRESGQPHTPPPSAGPPNPTGSN